MSIYFQVDNITSLPHFLEHSDTRCPEPVKGLYRRSFILLKMKKILLSCLLCLLFPMILMGKKEKPIVTFGVVTDLHYNNEIEHQGTRYYQATRGKLREAVDTFNAHRVDFVAVLGDIVDFKLDSYADIEPLFASLHMPVHKVFGNHDFLGTYGTELEAQVEKTIGREAPYYAHTKHGVRFIFLDSNDIGVLSRSADTPEGIRAREMVAQLKAESANDAHEWNGTLSTEQQNWLLRQVQKAQKRHQMVFCLAHMPLMPLDIAARDFRGAEICTMLEQYPCVKAYLTGHHHTGSMMLTGKLKHYGFQGMIEGTDNHYAIVSIYKNRMEIEGFGKQESRTIFF